MSTISFVVVYAATIHPRMSTGAAEKCGDLSRTEIISEIYGELPFFITTSEKGKGVGSLSEDISGAVMSGKGIVIFDNLRGVLDSTLLESAIRGGRMIQARVLLQNRRTGPAN